MDLNQLLYQLLHSVLNVLIIPLLPIVTAYLIAYIKRKTSELESNLKNRQLINYTDIAENAIISSVAAVNQIYVDNIKNVYGLLSQAEQKNAFEMARSNVLSIVEEAGISALNQLYKDSEAYLNNRIEYYVSLSKVDK